ncbi:MAG TPA: PVC-type heme-binding CxxCH protein [Candidatus Dormibacteraeota bacterium]|nr:PVC-type heme-binding CxxCH protein [Candidatus Dormibacteraeota bacterium]
MDIKISCCGLPGVITTLIFNLFLGTFVAGAANPLGTGPTAASECANQFKTAEGLQVSLFASEPMVRNPTDFDIDERGRVWVAEGVNYRSSFQRWGTLESAGDRIVILEDTNGDGLADKQTVFYQDPSINAALGVCVLGNKVIVSDSPNVILLTDTDGDGKADKRELLFTGIAGVDHDHGVHAFSFGPDGKLYFNMGNESKHLFYPLQKEVPLHGLLGNVPMKPVVDVEGNEVNATGKPYRMGMVFRCNLDGSEVETLAWNFRNNYEVAVDSFGTLWQSDNDDDGNRGVRINYVMEHGNFGYSDEMTGAGWSVGWDKAHALGATEQNKVFYEWHQFDPGVVPDLLHTGAGSPTGILIYEGDLLPEVFRNQILHCDAGPRVVRAYPVTKDGAGFKATIKDIITTPDTWFRPSDLCVAPDGSLLVSDWNDAGVGGHNMADQKVADMTGRIYRVAPVGSKLSVPGLDLRSVDGCIAALESPNLSRRYLGWTGLHEMGGKAEPALLKVWHGSNARMRARALHLLARIDGKAKHYTDLAINDSDPDIRITGLRAARALKVDVIPAVTALGDDTSAQVRRECALALRHNSSPQAAELWAQLAGKLDQKDRWYLEALGIGADAQWDRFLARWLKDTGPKWSNPGGRELVWRSRATNSPALLTQLIRDPNATLEQQRHFFRALDFTPARERDAALVELAGLKAGAPAAPKEIAFEALSRLKNYDLNSNGGVKAAVLKMLESVRGTPEFLELVREFKIPNQETGLVQLAEKEPFDGANVEAVRYLLRGHDASQIKHALDGRNAGTVVRALAGTGAKEMVPLLTPIVSDTNRPVTVRKLAVEALAQVRDGAAELVKLAESSKLPTDLRLVAATELSQSRWQKIQDDAAQVLPVPQSRDAKPLPAVAVLARRSGNPAHGAKLFRQDTVGCMKCHQVNGEGIDFGPNLSEIGTKLGKDALYEAVLEPSAGISFGFEAWQLTLKNDDEPYGLIVSETPEELTLKTVGGIKTKYQKSEIAGRTQQKLSIMPAGLQQLMSEEDLVDLVEYLTGLKKRN